VSDDRVLTPDNRWLDRVGVPIPATDEPTEADRVLADEGAGGVRPRDARDEDPERTGAVHNLVNQPARPLTGDEKEAARRDPGKPPHREEDPR